MRPWYGLGMGVAWAVMHRALPRFLHELGDIDISLRAKVTARQGDGHRLLAKLRG